jgi:hypothetical protein
MEGRRDPQWLVLTSLSGGVYCARLLLAGRMASSIIALPQLVSRVSAAALGGWDGGERSGVAGSTCGTVQRGRLVAKQLN